MRLEVRSSPSGNSRRARGGRLLSGLADDEDAGAASSLPGWVRAPPNFALLLFPSGRLGAEALLAFWAADAGIWFLRRRSLLRDAGRLEESSAFSPGVDPAASLGCWERGWRLDELGLGSRRRREVLAGG